MMGVSSTSLFDGRRMVCSVRIPYTSKILLTSNFYLSIFHKSIALITGKPELKGIKALDRFARLIGRQSLNDVAQFLKGYDKRLRDFGEFDKDRTRYEYADLLPRHFRKKTSACLLRFF